MNARNANVNAERTDGTQNSTYRYTVVVKAELCMRNCRTKYSNDHTKLKLDPPAYENIISEI